VDNKHKPPEVLLSEIFEKERKIGEILEELYDDLTSR